MSNNQLSNSLNAQSSSTNDIDPSESLDGAVLKLAAQAAFVQAFADGLADLEVPVEKVAPARTGGEIDFGWRAGLRL